MSMKMGRMTKRNRAKYRRRAYEAGMVGMRRRLQAAGTDPVQPERPTDRTPRDICDKRAA